MLKYFRFVKLTLLEILVMIHSQFMMVDLNHLSKLVNFVEIHSHLIRSSPQAINYCFILKQVGLELILDFRLVTTLWVSFTNQFLYTLIPWLLRISVVRFSLVGFFKKCYFYYIRNVFLVTNDLSAADLVHADFCQT